ncbi:MAG: 2-phosphoglycolate phosphatase [Pseudohongiellaceae bacterium]
MSSITSPEAILFDLDGTLVDTSADFVLVLNSLREKYNFPALPAQLIRDTVSNGARALTKLAFGEETGPIEFEAKRLELLELYAEIVGDQAQLFDGMNEVLCHFEALNIPWGIVTNKPRRFTNILLEKLSLSARSAITLCPDDVVKAKPDPESLFLACTRLQCKPQNTVYVGDHERDIIAGKAAAMKTVAARYGYILDKKKVSCWQADYEIDHPSELISLFINLN